LYCLTLLTVVKMSSIIYIYNIFLFSIIVKVNYIIVNVNYIIVNVNYIIVNVIIVNNIMLNVLFNLIDEM